MVAILPYPGSGIPVIIWIIIGSAVLIGLLWCILLNILLGYEFYQSYKTGSIGYTRALRYTIRTATSARVIPLWLQETTVDIPSSMLMASKPVNKEDTRDTLEEIIIQDGRQKDSNVDGANNDISTLDSPFQEDHGEGIIQEDNIRGGYGRRVQKDNGGAVQEDTGGHLDEKVDGNNGMGEEQNVASSIVVTNEPEEDNTFIRCCNKLNEILEKEEFDETEQGSRLDPGNYILGGVSNISVPLVTVPNNTMATDIVSDDEGSSTLCQQEDNVTDDEVTLTVATAGLGRIDQLTDDTVVSETNECPTSKHVDSTQQTPVNQKVKYADVYSKDIEVESTAMIMNVIPNVMEAECCTDEMRKTDDDTYIHTANTIVSRPLNIWHLEDILSSPGYLEREYQQLPNPRVDRRRLPLGIADKNRYCHVLPAPHSRVQVYTDSQSCYINGDFVRGCNGNITAYIATQGPMKNTVQDFWHMILEYKCPIVIMTTDCTIQQCHQYWTDHGSVIYGDVIVTTFDVIHCDGYIKRIMTVCIEAVGDLFKITHYQLTCWPVHEASFMDSKIMIDLLKKIDLKNEINPVVVHCSSGIERTSVVIAIDQSIQTIDKNDNDNIDIMLIISRLRLDRPGSVTNSHQYRYIHQVIHDYIFSYVYGTQEDV